MSNVADMRAQLRAQAETAQRRAVKQTKVEPSHRTTRGLYAEQVANRRRSLASLATFALLLIVLQGAVVLLATPAMPGGADMLSIAGVWNLKGTMVDAGFGGSFWYPDDTSFLERWAIYAHNVTSSLAWTHPLSWIVLFGGSLFTTSALVRLRLFAPYEALARKARPVEARRVGAVLGSIARRCGEASPAVEIVESDAVDGYIRGRPGAATIGLTSGSVVGLNDAQLEAMLAHMMARLACGGLATMVLAHASTFYFVRMVTYNMREARAHPFVYALMGLCMLVLASLLKIGIALVCFAAAAAICMTSLAIRRRVVRHAVFAADALSLDTTKNPAALASVIRLAREPDATLALAPLTRALLFSASHDSRPGFRPGVDECVRALETVTTLNEGDIAAVARTAAPAAAPKGFGRRAARREASAMAPTNAEALAGTLDGRSDLLDPNGHDPLARFARGTEGMRETMGNPWIFYAIAFAGAMVLLVLDSLGFM